MQDERRGAHGRLKVPVLFSQGKRGGKCQVGTCAKAEKHHFLAVDPEISGMLGTISDRIDDVLKRRGEWMLRR